MQLKQKIYETKSFAKLKNFLALGSTEIAIRNAAGSLFSFISAFVFENLGENIFVITQGSEFAKKVADDLATIAGENVVFEFVPDEDVLADDIEILKIKFSNFLALGEKRIFVVPAHSLLEEIPDFRSSRSISLHLRVGEMFGYERLVNFLNTNGFEKRKYVEDRGNFATRGSIIDVFDFAGENPIRVEFIDDEIASIREFDILTQRSLKNLSEVIIVPKLTNFRAENIKLIDVIKNSVCVVEDEDVIERILEEEIFEGVELKMKLNVRRFENDGVEVSNEVDFSSVEQPFFNSSMTLFAGEISKLLSRGYEVFVLCGGGDQTVRMKELVEEILGVEQTMNVNFLTELVNFGFILQKEKIAVFTEHQIFNRVKAGNFLRRRKFKGITLHELEMLKPGDFVVHVDYGIGKFAGLQKIKVNGIEQEVVKLEYADGGVLYVNLNYINRIKKYKGEEGVVPKLNRLGSGEWERIKERTKEGIKRVARDLIWLYAKRSYIKGFKFSPDNFLQREMEASFIYEDTPDQRRATIEVKQDMESDKPMDRLICGDVGFGKTEVAIRAAFKAVLDKKQVAVLVPTTILAYQHYKTFTERLKNYPVRIEVLSRLVSKRKQAEILNALRNGEVDIIIGTHRLLSKDVRFKDLGLLIIDEEHRFGVEAKEKLRKVKVNVDTLTLSATPIPRTLYFALMGARDMSIINTPPPNRLPIITKILSSNAPNFKEIVQSAIYFEVNRGGQIYFVVDKISEIEDISNFVKSIAPDVKFDIVHGQMKPSAIEKVMLRFLDGKFDLLIATKIIEAGIDIPNVNTIFIYNAHTFGLAEIYQLRGRVGRSNRQAYAYLIVPPLDTIGANAIRRLVAIEEFTELGSGLSLAMKDMEIRGIGNLFGKEQTGFINSIGFDMYCKILEEAVDELKQEEFRDIFKEQRKMRKKIDSIVSADIEAYIPEYYIELDYERFNYYRRLYDAESIEEIDEIKGEIEDRFGKCSDEVENLIILAKIKVLAEKAGIQRVEIGRDGVKVELKDEIQDFKFLTDYLLQRCSLRFETLAGKTRLVLKFKGVLSVEQNVERFLMLIEDLSLNFSYNESQLASNP